MLLAFICSDNSNKHNWKTDFKSAELFLKWIKKTKNFSITNIDSGAAATSFSVILIKLKAFSVEF